MILSNKYDGSNQADGVLFKIRKNKNKSSGFTLIELMITVAIVGIIASVAYPSYVDSVARSDRTEAQRELLRIANLEEQFFSDNRVYTTDMTKLTLPASALTESGNYQITATITASTFKLTATAKASQLTKDPDCTTLSIDETGKKTAENTTCWEK